jgi:hypothetical protein
MAVTHDAIWKRSLLGRWLRKVLLSFRPRPRTLVPRETPASHHPQDDFWTAITPHIR